MINLENTTKEQVMIDLLRRGNEDAFRYFYDRYWNVVYHFIRQKCQSPTLAENGSQEVFQNLWINRAQISHGIVLKHMLAMGCMRAALAALKNRDSKSLTCTPTNSTNFSSEQVQYTVALIQHITELGQLAKDLTRLEPKSFEQFIAELDFVGMHVRETKQLASTGCTSPTDEIFPGACTTN